MQSSDEYIHALIAGKLTGTLSHEEDLYLQQLIAENEHIRAQWEQIKDNYSAQDIENRFSRIDNWDWATAEELIAQSNRKQQQKTRWVVLFATAALLSGICFGIFYLINNKQQAPFPIAANLKKGVTLQLVNGNTINLSEGKDSMTLGNTLLRNRHKTLSLSTSSPNLSDAATAGNSMNSLTVPTGMDYQIVLSDGSKIWLNAATKLQFPFAFAAKTREITVDGEAYVEVAKNAAKPFIVHTPGGTIQVLGTSFNINSYDSGVVRVALVEGAVNFKTAAGETPIKPGIEALYTGKGVPALHKFDDNEVLGWRTGKYYFTEATFEDIVKVLPRWFGVDVVIENPVMRKERFSGMVNRNKPISVFLQKIKKLMDVDYYFDKDGVLHFK